MTIRLITLGGLHGTQNNVEQEWLRSQALRAALLTYLAVERTSTRDALQLLLWPETDATSAGHRLNQTVYALRRTLGDEYIATKGRNILAGEGLTTDAVDFEQAVAAGRYDDAIDLYRGPFLSGVHLVNTEGFETWVDARRARHGRMFRKACRAVVEARCDSGDLAGALIAAEAWVEGDPGDDEARHRLIELFALNGKRMEALKQYEAYTRLLEKEGLEPLEETRQLVAALERPSNVNTSPPTTSAVANPSPLASRLDKPIAFAKPTPSRADRPSRLGADLDPQLESDLSPSFEILRHIGSGTAARVYLARDTALQRLVAIKVLLPDFANDKTARARFEREGRAAAKVVHPNVVAVYQVAHLSDGTPYLVMEYVEGRNLADTLAAEGSISQAEACSVLSQVAAALAAAHARGLIHRDVRPANIVWTRETGRVVLMDFGIVAVVESGAQAAERLTASGEVIGDPAFNSPEQLRPGPITVATDIYSLGILGYELLTRRGPYTSASRAGVLEAHLNQAPEPLTVLRPGTNPELSDLLQRCLNKIPERRPSAREVARTLERIRALLDPAHVSLLQARFDTGVGRKSVFGNFLDDLRRRGIHKVATVYVATSLLLLNGGDLVLPALRASGLYDVLVAVVLGGFPVALVLGWVFDFTRTGIHRTAALDLGVASTTHRVLGFIGLGLSVVLAAVIGWWVLSG